MSNPTTKVIITGEDRTKAAFSSINRQMGDLKSNAAQLGKMFGALFGAASVAGLAAFAKSRINAADALNDMSQRTGVAVKTLAEYKLAATLADTSLDDLAKGIQRLTLSQGQAEQGGKAQAAALLRLGISAKDPRLAFEQLADAVANSNDPTKLAVDLNALLGRSYVNLLPLLQGGSQALRDSADASASFAESMVKLAPDAAKLNDQLDLMKVNAAGAAGALLAELVPALNDVFERIGLVKQLIGAGGLFNTLVNTAGTDDIGEVMRRVRGEIELTQRAIDGERARGKDASPFEQKLRGLNAQLQILIANRTKALMAPPETETNKLIKADRAAGGLVDLSGSDSAAAAAAARDRKATHAADLALRAEQSAQGARLEQDDIARAIAANQRLYDDKLIKASDYYATLNALQRTQADSEIALLQTQRAAAEAVTGSQADQLKATAEIARINASIELIARRAGDQRAANARAQVIASRQAVQSAQDLVDSLQQEAFLLGLTNAERARAIALLDLEKLAVNLTAEEYEKLGAALNAALDSRESAEARKASLEAAQRQSEDIRTALTQNLQRSIADVLNTGFTGDGARGAILGFVDLLRTSLSNVIAANLTNSILSSFSDSALGSFGELFGFGGGKKDGSSPASAIYVKDVADGGALGAASGEGGGMFAGIFDTIKGVFGRLGSVLSNLFSSLASSLSGLFSGGGGSSNVGGWVSAIAGAFGYAEGGYTGAGGKHQPAGVVHAGEYVFSADSVRRLGLGALDNLHRIAKGTMIPRGARLGYAEGGLVNLPGSAAPNVSNKILNFVDRDEMIAEYLNTRAGERAIINVFQRNPGAFGA